MILCTIEKIIYIYIYIYIYKYINVLSIYINIYIIYINYVYIYIKVFFPRVNKAGGEEALIAKFFI